jgi:hypothetical protein
MLAVHPADRQRREKKLGAPGAPETGGRDFDPLKAHFFFFFWSAASRAISRVRGPRGHLRPKGTHTGKISKTKVCHNFER